MKILGILKRKKNLEQTKEIATEEITRQCRPNVSVSIEDLRSFLESTHIKKSTINKVIELYKKGIVNQVRRSEFKEQLEKLNLEEITIGSIVDYVTRFDYRKGIKK